MKLGELKRLTWTRDGASHGKIRKLSRNYIPCKVKKQGGPEEVSSRYKPKIKNVDEFELAESIEPTQNHLSRRTDRLGINFKF